MTWGLALIQEAPVCRNMSKHVTCRSGLRCLLAIFGATPKLDIFGPSFGMKGPMQLFPVCRSRPQGRLCGDAAHFGSSEARLMCFHWLFFIGQQPPLEEQGMCYDGISVVEQDLKPMRLSEFPH